MSAYRVDRKLSAESQTDAIDPSGHKNYLNARHVRRSLCQAAKGKLFAARNGS